MAKIVPRRFGTDLPPDTDLKEVRWYFAPASQADFVATVDATVDTLAASFVTPVQPGDKRIALQITEKAGLEPGDWQLATVAVDKAGNYGDAYQLEATATNAGWTNVPLDFSPPGRCSNGSVD
jgi:hypothetical protein